MQLLKTGMQTWCRTWRFSQRLLGSSLMAALTVNSAQVLANEVPAAKVEPSVVAAPVSTPAASSASVDSALYQDWAKRVIYFVVLDRFADGDSKNNTHLERKNPGGYHGGDLKGLIANLDEIASLGATAIWITPINKQSDYFPWNGGAPGSGWERKQFQHSSFHGYWANDFTQVDPRFGTEEQLKQLVEESHKRGIKVLLDIVYNHPGYDATFPKEWLNNNVKDCDGDEDVLCSLAGLPDFKTTNPEVRKYLMDAHIGLAKRTGLDGFRLDTVKHVEHDFWQQHRKRTRDELGQDFFLIGEVWGGEYVGLDDWFKNDEMDAGFDFSFRGSCMGFVEKRGRAFGFARYLEKRHKVRTGYQLSHFLSSHDEPMTLAELNNDKTKFRLCVAAQMTSFGIPMIYYGEEVARGGSFWPTNRNDMPWGKKAIMPGKGVKRDEDLRAYYQQLIAIRKQNPALSLGATKLLSGKDDELVVYAREDAQSGNTVVVALNRLDKPVKMSVAAPEAFLKGTPKALLAKASVSVKDGQLEALIAKESAQIFVIEQSAQK